MPQPEPLDLRDALYCLRILKERGVYSNEKIGVLYSDVYGMVRTDRKGTIVLFRNTSSTECTIEIPYSIEQIKKRDPRNLIISMGCTVGVPLRLVQEIIVE